MANFSILVVVLFFYIIDCITKISNECTDFYGIMLATLIGLFIGMCWAAIFMKSNPSYLYYNLPSNAEICSRPSNQKFKCNVYKNGEILN